MYNEINRLLRLIVCGKESERLINLAATKVWKELAASFFTAANLTQSRRQPSPQQQC